MKLEAASITDVSPGTTVGRDDEKTRPPILSPQKTAMDNDEAAYVAPGIDRDDNTDDDDDDDGGGRRNNAILSVHDEDRYLVFQVNSTPENAENKGEEEREIRDRRNTLNTTGGPKEGQKNKKPFMLSRAKQSVPTSSAARSTADGREEADYREMCAKAGFAYIPPMRAESHLDREARRWKMKRGCEKATKKRRNDKLKNHERRKRDDGKSSQDKT